MKKRIAIVGGGLVGSLLAIYLVKRGYVVNVFERRHDPRKTDLYAGRSINLALSTRGLKSLEEVGLAAKIRQEAIPMHGRMMHNIKGELSFLPYGKEGQFINSISRASLNVMLINEAENLGAQYTFNHRCTHVDLDKTTLTFQDEDHHITQKQFHQIVGADGAFSAVRGAMQFTDRFDFSQDYIDHGYKELTIPAGHYGSFQLEKNALHIWPRESFMMIALPNPDGSFTCTLFFPFEGKKSFDALKDLSNVEKFFQDQFPDAVKLMPDLLKDFQENPTSSLVTMQCYPWCKNNTLLIGDAAHAIVPFYGQGMNAGFEDCRILNKLLNETHDDWSAAAAKFQTQRKPNADAIAKLALDNFVEMRDLVGDPEFLLRKKIESHLHTLFPTQWIPLYSMVTFNENIAYADAYAIGQKQKKIMDEVMRDPNITTTWQSLPFQQIVDQLNL
ncbi:FAD-dependent oxidoreductase [Pseudochryseolinea flava]|uniref:Kynurenine 3-monooxygenase n=1 Tax=Pseudochryseolinea flava TaxID=2059302 RepID=A0A364Y738_9BACT|nr:NAD(P)/FAD-dependent oxidoreductase [Pseudochryseolinea flava]RAW02713.1 kynurenine 3-monooxygenase [Pseudochryseolinea flava]